MVAKEPCVAGQFYPQDKAALEMMVNTYVHRSNRMKHACPKALIAPHAGYIYSGEIAGAAYATLLEKQEAIQRVVLVGPAHRVPFIGIATTGVDQFRTPIGGIPVDHEWVNKAIAVPKVRIFEDAFQFEHSLEVHLPFLQMVLKHFSLVPFVIGDVMPSDIAELLTVLWGDESTLIVVSSDLSHYHSYERAKKIDQQTSEAIINLHPERIKPEGACGRLLIQGLLQVVKAKGLKTKQLDVRNSGDTAGPKNKVVGYGAYIFGEDL